MTLTPLNGQGSGIERLRFDEQPQRLPPHKLKAFQRGYQIGSATIDAIMPRHGCNRPGQHRGVISMPVQCTCPTCGVVFFRSPTKRKRYCSEACRPVVTDADRFWSRVDKSGPVPAHRPDLGPCWLWTGPLTEGYGQSRLEGQTRQAHVVSLLIHGRAVGDGLTVDHICHNGDSACVSGSTCQHRRCVRPEHLEPVTRAGNVLRGNSFGGAHARTTNCPKGHPYDEANTILEARSGGGVTRKCLECRRAYDRRRGMRRGAHVRAS